MVEENISRQWPTASESDVSEADVSALADLKVVKLVFPAWEVSAAQSGSSWVRRPKVDVVALTNC